MTDAEAESNIDIMHKSISTGMYRLLSLVGLYGRDAHNQFVEEIHTQLRMHGFAQNQPNVLNWVGSITQEQYDGAVARMVELHGFKNKEKAS